MKPATQRYHDMLNVALVAERIAWRFATKAEKEEFTFQSALAAYYRYKLRRLRSPRVKAK